MEKTTETQCEEPSMVQEKNNEPVVPEPLVQIQLRNASVLPRQPEEVLRSLRELVV